jgi:hypothetical protein
LLGNGPVNTPPQQYKGVFKGFMPKGYKRTKKVASGQNKRVGNRSSRVGSEGLSFKTPACQDMSLGAEEMNGIESSELAVAEYGQERELGCS